MTRARISVYLSALALIAVVAVALFVGFEQRGAERSLTRAIEYRERGEISASIIELKNTLQDDPQNVTARLSLGRTYLDIGDLISARKELERARTYGAAVDAVAEPLSRTWLLQQDYQRVLDELPADGAEGDTKAIVLVARARAYVGLEQLDAAHQAITAALKAQPANVDAWVEQARISLRREDFSTAQIALEKLIGLAPGNLEADALRGDFYLRTGDYAAAAATYEQVLERLPGHVPTKVALANALLAQGDAEAGARALAEALDRAPTSADANYLNAVIALGNQDYATALDGAGQALRANPDHLPSLLVAGAAEFGVGRLESAARDMRQALAAAPDNQFAAELLVAIEERQARQRHARAAAVLIDDSASLATVATAIDPAVSREQILAATLDYLERDRSAIGAVDGRLVNQAITMIRQGRSAAAMNLIDAKLEGASANAGFFALAGAASLLIGEANQSRLLMRSVEDQQADTAEIQYLLAVAYRELGDRSSYRSRLARSLASDAVPQQAVGESVRLALEEGALERAETALRALAAVEREQSGYLDLAGGLALLRGDFDGAARTYRQALSAAPTSVRALRLAYAEQRAGRPAASRAVLRDWLDGNPNDAMVMLALANKRLSAGEFLDAAELYAAVLRQVPEHIVAINNLAWVSLQLEDANTALRLAQQGLDLAPEDSRIMDTAAEIFIAQHRYDEAVPLLKRALQRDQSNPGLKVRLASALALTGSPNDAAQLLEETLAAHGEFTEREQAEQLLNGLVQ